MSLIFVTVGIGDNDVGFTKIADFAAAILSTGSHVWADCPNIMATTFINGKFTAQFRTGVQRYALELVRALDEWLLSSGSDADFVLLCPPMSSPPPLGRIRVQVTSGPRVPLHLWEQSLLPWHARSGLLVSLAGSAPALARRQVCTIHDAAVFDQPQAYSAAFVAWYRWLFRRLALRAEVLVTVSRFSRWRLADALQTQESRWELVPGAADHLDAVAACPTVLSRLGLLPGRFLLAVASDNPSKNLPRLLAAFKQLPARQGLALVLVGGHNKRVFAQSASQAEADPPGVVRAGQVDDRELKALYLSARALVFPSLYEGFGLPPVEAMRCGCPAAVSREAALLEVCGDAAFILDAHDTSALARGLRRLLDDDALCVQLQERGRRRTEGLLWQNSAQALVRSLRPLQATG